MIGFLLRARAGKVDIPTTLSTDGRQKFKLFFVIGRIASAFNNGTFFSKFKLVVLFTLKEESCQPQPKSSTH